MPYPKSPFPNSFNTSLLVKNEGDVEHGIQTEVDRTLQWLCTSPKISTYRINTLKYNMQEAKRIFSEYLEKLDIELDLFEDEHVPNVLCLRSKDCGLIELHDREVIVDVACGQAILRGAHIFAPGVLGMIGGTKKGDIVSIYADLNEKCKKGFMKRYEDEGKLLIGNGIVLQNRTDLFGNTVPKGIAVHVTKTISGCPPLGDEFLENWAILQNLPSMICVSILNPQPNETVLDMCASPGNKTTHIAELMGNKGTLYAIDKTPSRLNKLKEKCSKFCVNAICIEADSTKLNFEDEFFDRILLDAPCSGLGQRPQLSNSMQEKIVKSYPALQKNLFKSGIRLLKSKGVLVYSTCTITVQENEDLVAWVLKTFPNMKLTKPDLYCGSPGWPSNLSEENRLKVQRFGPDSTIDSVGFFIACFVKL